MAVGVEGTDDVDLDAALGVAKAMRADIQELMDRQIACVRAYPSYREVPDEDLQRSTRRNVQRVVAVIEGQDPYTDEIEEAEDLSSTLRASQGVPAVDVIAAYRDCLGVLRDAFISIAVRRELADSVVVLKLRQIWELSDDLTHVLTDARHKADSKRARMDERARVEFLQRVLLGSATATDLATVGPAFGITPDDQYYVFRARGSLKELATMARHIESTARRPGFPPLIGPIDGDLVGISTKLPTLEDSSWTLAVSGPVAVDGLPQACAQVTRLLSVAHRFGERGIVTTETLGIKIAVASEDKVGAMFAERYIDPVLKISGGDRILRTVEVHLECGCRFETTAKMLHTHPNTARNRLRRFEELTDVDFDDFGKRLEIWWAIQYWHINSGDLADAEATPGLAPPGA